MKKWCFVRPLLRFFVAGMVILMVSRLVLFFIFHDRVARVEGGGWLFIVGARFDVIVMSYLSLIPIMVTCLLPGKWQAARGIRVYYCAWLIFLLFMELATPAFIRQYDTRPNTLFLEYLVYPREVFTMLVKGRPWDLIGVLAALMASVWMAIRWGGRFFAAPVTGWTRRLIAFPLIFFALFAGARGSLFSKRPINTSNAVFSLDQLTNSLGLNSTYTVLYAAYASRHETDVAKMYGDMDANEAFTRVKRYMDVPGEDFSDPDVPFLHVQRPTRVRDRPLNVVIFLQESLGAEFVGCLGGMKLTP
ncbi:MAG: LTA synthase family protein, partial [Odoribacteraceae bacterium]|nr:LTA synthase family protein [Odoribacteraceae bacterium]